MHQEFSGFECRFCKSPFTLIIRRFSGLNRPLYHCLGCDGVFAVANEGQEMDDYSEVYRLHPSYRHHADEFNALRQGRLPRLGWNRRQFGRIFGGQISGTRVVEIGAGVGVFGAYCVKKGARYQGYDIAHNIVQDVCAVLNIPMRQGGTREVLEHECKGTVDFLAAWEVFEHIYDIRAELVAMHSLLKPQGFLVFSVPNYLRFRYNEAGKLGQDGPPIHYNFWSPNALNNFLRVCGFQVLLLRVKCYRELRPPFFISGICDFLKCKFGKFSGPTIFVVARPVDYSG